MYLKPQRGASEFDQTDAWELYGRTLWHNLSRYGGNGGVVWCDVVVSTHQNGSGVRSTLSIPLNRAAEIGRRLERGLTGLDDPNKLADR